MFIKLFALIGKSPAIRRHLFKKYAITIGKLSGGWYEIRNNGNPIMLTGVSYENAEETATLLCLSEYRIVQALCM